MYVWRFVEAAYFREPRKDIVPAPVPASMWIPTAVLLAAVVIFGLDTTYTVDPAVRAAEMLMGGPR